MMVTPLPGISRNNLRDVLRDVMTRLDNLSRSEVDDYLEWVVHAARVLGSQVSSTDIEQLVHTRGYDRLLSFAVGTARVRVMSTGTPNEVAMTHPQKIEDVNFWELLDAPHEPVHIVVSMVIVGRTRRT